MITLEHIKSYGWYLFGIAGVIFFWAGVWDGVGYLPYLENPFISLLAGFILLTISPIIFPGKKSFWEKPKVVDEMLHGLAVHPHKQEFHVKYWDNQLKKELHFHAKHLHRIEKGFLIFLDKEGKELFVPVHRVTEILHKGKTHWKPRS